MPGFTSVTSDESIMYADNASFDGTERGGGLQTDGQLWIGATALPHVRRATLTAGTGVSITNGAGSITIGLAGGGVGIDQIKPNSGTDPVVPDGSGQVSILGPGTNSSIQTIGGMNLLSLPSLSEAKFIVSSSGLPSLSNYSQVYSTIQSAHDAASSGDTIYVLQGTYTENITITKSINFVSFSAYIRRNTLNTSIVGTVTVATNGINVGFYGIEFTTNAAVSFSVTSTTTQVTCQNCHFNATNANSINMTGGTTTNFYIKNSSGTLANTYTLFTTTLGLVWIFDSIFFDITGTPGTSTTTAGAIRIFNSIIRFPLSSSATGSFLINNSQFGTQQVPYQNTTWITTTDAEASVIDGSKFNSGTASALSIGAIMTCTNTVINTSNASAIAGAGTLNYGNLSFSGTSSLIATTTQVPLVESNDAIKIRTPGAYPYTTVPQDGLILVDTSAARTITPLASPTTGQRHIIKDSVGSAAANNITVTPSGKNIDGGASYIINVAYGSITICYNGTEWSVI